jgi:hypothetical protein
VFLIDPDDPILRFQVLPNLFYLQGWIPREVVKCLLVDIIPWDWEPDALEGTWWNEYGVSEFVEGSSSVLFWESSEEDVWGRRLRSPW